MSGYLSLDIICSSKLTVFLKLHSWKGVVFSEQIMFADKHLSIFFALGFSSQIFGSVSDEIDWPIIQAANAELGTRKMSAALKTQLQSAR